MKKPQELDKFIAKLPPNRQLLAAKLMEHNWFNNSKLSIQKSLLSLPHDFEGFVYDMCHRHDRLGNIEIISLEKLLKSAYLISPVFKVYSHASKNTFTQEYVSWKMGSNPGVKGTLFVEVDNNIKYFITIETVKFPIGSHSFDSIGGLIQFSRQDLLNLPDNIGNAIKDQLGLTDIKIKHFYDLGKVQVDNGLTSNHPSIFAAVIDGDEIHNITNINNKPSKTEPLEFKVSVVPIEQLDMYISKIDDSFFLSVISRMLSKKLIQL